MQAGCRPSTSRRGTARASYAGCVVQFRGRPPFALWSWRCGWPGAQEIAPSPGRRGVIGDGQWSWLVRPRVGPSPSLLGRAHPASMLRDSRRNRASHDDSLLELVLLPQHASSHFVALDSHPDSVLHLVHRVNVQECVRACIVAWTLRGRRRSRCSQRVAVVRRWCWR